MPTMAGSLDQATGGSTLYVVTGFMRDWELKSNLFYFTVGKDEMYNRPRVSWSNWLN